MRTSNSIKNSFMAVASSVVTILIGFITQKIFVMILDAEYLGVNGLFSNVIAMLSIAELGIGEAIIFHLYEPIAKDDKKRILPLLRLYRNAYNIIALVILILGLCVIPFLPYFIGKNTLDLNFNIVYVLFLLQTVCSYLLSYKRSILYAYQKNYIVNIINIIYLIVLNFSQIIVLYLTRNYYLYLIIKIICILLENVVINIVANRKYPFIKESTCNKLDRKTEKDIFKRVRAQFLHKIAGFVVNSTDNILISKFVGILSVGLYANYNMIISAVRGLFLQLISSITASVGNLLVENNREKSFVIYKRLRFLNFWISTFCSVSILVIIQKFIILWLGEEYLLSNFVLVVLVFNLYQKMMRSCNDVFLTAAGICVENRFVPVAESILNIVFSILLFNFFGLAGIFLGTIISGLALWLYSYPKFVYQKIFGKSYASFVKDSLGYIILFVVISVITYIISLFLVVDNIIIQLIIYSLICLFIPNIIMYYVFRKSDNFNYFILLIKRVVGKFN